MISMISPIPSVPLFALYPETHFRFFRGFPSLLYRRFPEVVFDMPRRVAPGKDLPVVLAINDIDRFPVAIDSIAIAVSTGSVPPVRFEFGDGSAHVVEHVLSQRCTVMVFMIPRSALGAGVVHVNARASVRRPRRAVEHILNDNFVSTSKMGMSAVVASESLPMQGAISYGDMHVHSQYSESHVEFGLPPAVVGTLCSAAGLDFAVLTDHSYDLLNRLDNYLAYDAERSRWAALQDDIARHSGSVALIGGEEISALNRRRGVVHLGAVGLRDMVEGSLDGARKGRAQQPQPTLVDAAHRVHAQGGTVFAAHPGARVGLLQSILLRRGDWGDADVIGSGIDAYQAVNGSFREQWHRARQQWVRALAAGHRLALVAGNDAHGDFNRYRCIHMPFVSISEMFDRYLGFTLTGVYGTVRSAGDLSSAVRDGRTFVTSGPALTIQTPRSPGQCAVHSLPVENPREITVAAKCSAEQGNLRELRILIGTRGSAHERAVVSRAEGRSQGTLYATVDCSEVSSGGWVRAECTSVDSNGLERHAATSPLYIA